jgi:small subunit ribosomal protein S7
MTEKFFDKYDISEIVIQDKGLARYINLETTKIHNHARYAGNQFGKSQVPLLERLINHMMRTEKYTGKKIKAYKVVKQAFEIIEKKTKQNPLQILVKGIENSAPREEVIRLFYSGISVPQAVDTAPQRRLDKAIRNICQGAVASTHGKKISISECLAEEIIKASNDDATSFAITKKGEIERIAKSAR